MSSENNVEKKKDNAIAIPDNISSLGGMAVNDDDITASDLYPSLKCCQGTPQEQDEFGSMPAGMFYENIEGTKYGTSVYIAPIIAAASWTKWDRDSRSPDYVVYSRDEVPAQDLEWKPDGSPPDAAKAVNVLCFVGVPEDSVEELGLADITYNDSVPGIAWLSTPHIVVFRRTGLAAYRRVMMRVEARRMARKDGPGVYLLSSERERNTAGQPYQRLTLSSTGRGLAEFRHTLVPWVSDMQTELASVRERMIASANADAYSDGADDASTDGEGTDEDTVDDSAAATPF